MRSRIFILIIIILLIAVVAVGIFYFRGRQGEPEAASQPAPQETQVSAELLLGEPVISPVLSFSGDTVWYLLSDGRMFRKGLDGSSEPEEYLLSEALESPQEVIWQEKGSDFIIRQTTAGHTRYQFFDAETTSFIEYPGQIRQVGFLPDEQGIVYIWARGDGGHELKTAGVDSQNFEKTADLFRTDYEFAVSPSKNEIVLFSASSDEPVKLMLVNLDTGEFKDLDEEDFYRDAKFSPDGGKVLVKKNAQWVVYDLDNAPNSPFPSLPKRGDGGELSDIVWGRNSDELILATSSSIASFNLSFAQQQTLYQFDQNEIFIPVNLLLHPDGSVLLFVDEQTGYLYKVKI